MTPVGNLSLIFFTIIEEVVYASAHAGFTCHGVLKKSVFVGKWQISGGVCSGRLEIVLTQALLRGMKTLGRKTGDRNSLFSTRL